ncbi:hypothetical protein CLAFUW4_09480 [Fulvia fulva]|uniref:Uncharacterized protein n=1 Tax=Passalora fulva TaxID=5499 RepID=A0A9Q8PG44_PASFU|nr:uncharacterized protein CLAFUR5_09577 [Fulvia fulva]KAK4614104.1 hypothetical protein CLAFUR4_09486 [Fulvia fulva]KAK4615238.1 hypothetical protein CLAFUR0_09477 [Fulvia fulva]UJO21853.1 hypothetical protein CLAFUR5_09577 [Fulvia fulva]WPV20241.1 hypothetical protein CLAFUW4_09480 [Fulvia fulva]WPV35647.1 hypothetical protein CLAFUW7_09481 [Fulvia fulva]
MASSTTTTTTSSRLLALPAELRNRIYEQALYHNRKAGHVGAVALLRTCRKIHGEAYKLFLENSDGGANMSARDIGDWFEEWKFKRMQWDELDNWDDAVQQELDELIKRLDAEGKDISTLGD